MASLEGSLDAWNMFRILWWAFFGLVAALELYRNRQLLPAFFQTIQPLAIMLVVWLGAVFLSTMQSPAPLFTFGNAAMMLILVLASLDLALKLQHGVIEVERVLKLLFAFSLMLLCLLFLVLLVRPDLVGAGPGIVGSRVRGTVAQVDLLAVMVFYLALHFLIATRGWSRAGYGLTAAASFALLLLAQSRWAYIAWILAGIVFYWQWMLVSRYRLRALALGLTCIAASMALATLLLVDVSRTTPTAFTNAAAYLVRQPETLANASGRDLISIVVLNAVRDNPFGLGYLAGPRVLILNSREELDPHGVISARIGNAHNAYLEMLAGTGVVGAIGWLAIWGTIAVALWRHTHKREFIVVRALLVILILNGLIASEAAYPANQASALLWLIIAITIGTMHQNGPVRASSSQLLPPTGR